MPVILDYDNSPGDSKHPQDSCQHWRNLCSALSSFYILGLTTGENSKPEEPTQTAFPELTERSLRPAGA